MMVLSELQRQCFATAVEKGWWPLEDGGSGKWEVNMVQVNIPEKLMLMVTELGEAMEHYRSAVGMKEPVYLVPETGDFLTAAEVKVASDNIRQLASPKPDGFVVEIADTVIRIFDLMGAMGVDLEHAIAVKMAYNKTRPYRHGNKKC